MCQNCRYHLMGACNKFLSATISILEIVQCEHKFHFGTYAVAKIYFEGLEFEIFKKTADLNSFHLTPKKWIEGTDSIGIQSRAGR